VAYFGPEFGVRVPLLTAAMDKLVGHSEPQLELLGSGTGLQVLINGRLVSQSLPYTVRGLAVRSPIEVKVSGPNGTFQKTVQLKKGESRSLQVAFRNPAPSTQKAGRLVTLRLSVNPPGPGMKIMVNDSTLDPNNPVTQVAVDAGLELSVYRLGYKPTRREFVVSSAKLGGRNEWYEEINLEPARSGFLTIQTTPSSKAFFKVDGIEFAVPTPFENLPMPVGNYTVRLFNEALTMEKNVQVGIQEGKIANLNETLELSNGSRLPATQ
jgi:hypothetical protein